MKKNNDHGIVLSRINFGEKDRILTVLLKEYGKASLIAKGVRSPKSKLAGGIELFSESNFGYIEGRGEVFTLTSSRLLKHFMNIVKDIDASMYAQSCLKTISKLTPSASGQEYYQDLKILFDSLDKNQVPLPQIKIWYSLRLLSTSGALPNLITDNDDKSLKPDSKFQYDFDAHCFFEKPEGPYGSSHVKILRFLSKAQRPVEIKGAKNSQIASLERLVDLVLNQHRG